MKNSRFWTYLILTTILLLLANYYLHELDIFRPFIHLSWMALTVFFILSILLFFLGKLALKSSNKYAFIQLVIANVLLKLILAVAMVVAYIKIEAPESKYFILPFFLVYIVFSIFETWMLYRLAVEE